MELCSCGGELKHKITKATLLPNNKDVDIDDTLVVWFLKVQVQF